MYARKAGKYFDEGLKERADVFALMGKVRCKLVNQYLPRFPQPELLILIFLVVLFLSVLFHVWLAATLICVLKFGSAIPFTILLTFLSC